jgi:hypothetical protein
MTNYIPPYGLKYYQDFNQEQINLSFLFAIGNKDWPLTDFLLNSPELPFRADIYSTSNGPFIFALSSEDDEILKHLIFNLNIQKTEEIEKIIYKINNKHSKLANSMFQIRELNKELLSVNQIDKIFKL